MWDLKFFLKNLRKRGPDFKKIVELTWLLKGGGWHFI